MTPWVALAQVSTSAVDPLSFGEVGARSFLAIGAVGALLAGAVWFLRRAVDQRRGRQALSVESALSLGDKRSLVVVAVEGRRLLVGVAPGSVSLVTELHQSFQDTLSKSLDGNRQP